MEKIYKSDNIVELCTTFYTYFSENINENNKNKNEDRNEDYNHIKKSIFHIIEKNNKVTKETDKNKNYILHIITLHKEYNMLKELLFQYSELFEINCQNIHRETPLIIGCYQNRTEIVSLLLEYGAFPNILNIEKL